MKYLLFAQDGVIPFTDTGDPSLDIPGDYAYDLNLGHWYECHRLRIWKYIPVEQVPAEYRAQLLLLL